MNVQHVEALRPRDEAVRRPRWQTDKVTLSKLEVLTVENCLATPSEDEIILLGNFVVTDVGSFSGWDVNPVCCPSTLLGSIEQGFDTVWSKGLRPTGIATAAMDELDGRLRFRGHTYSPMVAR